MSERGGQARAFGLCEEGQASKIHTQQKQSAQSRSEREAEALAFGLAKKVKQAGLTRNNSNQHSRAPPRVARGINTLR